MEKVPISTAVSNPEIDPFRTALANPVPDIPLPVVLEPTIEKPARSMVTPSAVITRQSPVAVRLLASSYEPG
jgi:hypothetical protein